MAPEVVQCAEFSEIKLRVADLVRDGELTLDERVVGKGYLAATLNQGQIVLRSAGYVGLIPVAPGIAVRITPRASIANLSHMIAKSGVAPIAIPAFSRGYIPRFEVGRDVERLYGVSLVEGAKRVLGHGLAKAYVPEKNPPPWRGRLLVSRTVKEHAAKGIRFHHEFERMTLSRSTVENVALKAALGVTLDWYRRNARRDPVVVAIEACLRGFEGVDAWDGRLSDLVARLGTRLSRIPEQLGYYRDPLWTAFLILQSAIPDVGGDGSVTLDSLVVNVSAVFEAYVRRALFDRAPGHGWNVKDGNLRPSDFFVDAGPYTVHPDIVICEGQTPLAMLDAKYKPNPKEEDRYEVLAFMDALGVNIGGFVCPAGDNAVSRYMGTTKGGRAMSTLRFDLAAPNAEAEADRLFENVRRMLDGRHGYV